MLVEHSWLRVLGAGGHGLPAAGTLTSSRPMIGLDVLGGTFALGSGDRVEYFAPDSLDWLDLEIDGLDAFVDLALAGGLAALFAGLRWPGWEAEVAAVAPDRGIAVYPPLWSEEGQDIARCSRGVVPLAELVASHHDLAVQLAGVGDGEPVGLDIAD